MTDDTRLQSTASATTQAITVQPRVEEVMLHLFMMTMTFYHAHRDIKMTPQVLFVLRSLYRKAKSQDASLSERYASLVVAMDCAQHRQEPYQPQSSEFWR